MRSLPGAPPFAVFKVGFHGPYCLGLVLSSGLFLRLVTYRAETTTRFIQGRVIASSRVPPLPTPGKDGAPYDGK